MELQGICDLRAEQNLGCNRTAKDIETIFYEIQNEKRSEIQIGKIRKLTDIGQTRMFVGTGKNLVYRSDFSEAVGK